MRKNLDFQAPLAPRQPLVIASRTSSAFLTYRNGITTVTFLPFFDLQIVLLLPGSLINTALFRTHHLQEGLNMEASQHDQLQRYLRKPLPSTYSRITAYGHWLYHTWCSNIWSLEVLQVAAFGLFPSLPIVQLGNGLLDTLLQGFSGGAGDYKYYTAWVLGVQARSSPPANPECLPVSRVD